MIMSNKKLAQIKIRNQIMANPEIKTNIYRLINYTKDLSYEEIKKEIMNNLSNIVDQEIENVKEEFKNENL